MTRAIDAEIVGEWRHEGIELRARIESKHVTLETRLPGLRGSFALGHRDADDEPSEVGWTERERFVRLSVHCVFESDRAHDEETRFFALPLELRARMVELCETQRVGYIDFDDEVLSLYVGMTSDGCSADSCAEHVPALAAIARALPGAFKDAPGAVTRRHECPHCRHIVFLVAAATCCSRCGAPAP